ncbi:small glutamine-rich tetratricopeptide repeat-containing protein alpha [Lepeophtheirus salmonis]|uniref:Small glutamine-rich tetratricopeptide repeat-containing protein A n=1 Tax=Lepeophtheirus salmonis TaxID=72036 RepID=C1BS87_LEPSM|nr:small glutamine-rich tetratricopeptide repeat-containing protein alpha-like [Lepeophtheirus salmonis]ACO11890.1 Small glutamine-rich tetratricopeptide repeat-containing protein A [Lepeophtheirus salmonis]
MDRRRLIFSIVEFLNAEAADETNSFSPEAKESLEVANQCLQSAYALSQEDEHLRTEPSLLSLFQSATSHQPLQKKPTPSPEDKERAEQLKAEGNEALRNENAKEAIDKYSKAIEIDGSNQVFYCNRAAAYSKMDNHYAAIEDCKRALDMCPNYGKAYGRMGLAYSAVQRHKEAEECFLKALEIEPDNPNYKSNLSMAQSKVKEGNDSNNQNAGAFGAGMNAGSMGPGGLDLGGLLNNPGLMNMAMNMLSDPNMQNMMGQMMGGGMPSTGPPAAAAGGPEAGVSAMGMEGLLNAGQRLAEQMQQSHPDLVEQLRRHVSNGVDPSKEQPPQGGE